MIKNFIKQTILAQQILDYFHCYSISSPSLEKLDLFFKYYPIVNSEVIVLFGFKTTRKAVEVVVAAFTSVARVVCRPAFPLLNLQSIFRYSYVLGT